MWLGLERRSSPPSFRATVTAVGEVSRRGAEDGVDLVLAEQEADAVGEALDDLVLPLEHRGQVERQAADLDAVPGRIARWAR